MAVLTLAAAGGAFGGAGLFSRAEAAAGADLAVRYSRFSRAHAPHELVVEWVPRQATATLWLARPYLDALELQNIVPPPDAAEADFGRVYYTFRVREPGGPMQVRFMVEPTRAGWVGGRIGVDDGVDVTFRQFVFP